MPQFVTAYHNTIVTVAMLVAVLPMLEEHPPQILQIYRDSVKRGSGAAFKMIEEDAARICADLHCPNVHLAIESLAGPKEVWWLTPYESESDKQRVADGYATNPALMTALERIARRKAGLVGTPLDVLGYYRANLSRGAWRLAGARFLVVTVTKGGPHLEGSVFEADDGIRYTFRAVASRQQAEAIAAASGPETRLFAVRPYWGMPAREWIVADPQFWKVNPRARVR